MCAIGTLWPRATEPFPTISGGPDFASPLRMPMPLASAHVLLWLALLAVPACADQGEGPQAVCEDTRVIRNVSPDECQSDADCPSDLVCALDLVSEDLTWA